MRYNDMRKIYMYLAWRPSASCPQPILRDRIAARINFASGSREAPHWHNAMVSWKLCHR